MSVFVFAVPLLGNFGDDEEIFLLIFRSLETANRLQKSFDGHHREALDRGRAKGDVWRLSAETSRELAQT